MNNTYYLSHGGPGSGRYPLGSGERPYQKFEGSRRGISGYIRSVREKKAEKKAQKAQAKAQKEEEARAEAERKLEADRSRVLREGTASEVMRYQGKVSNQELQMAVDRIRLENQLKEYSKKEVSDGLETLKKVQSYTNVSSALAKDGISLWNSFASVYNATDQGKSSPMPTIGSGGNTDKNKK